MDTIYYVEDDEAIAYAVQTYFNKKGFQVTVVGNVPQAKLLIEKKLPRLCMIDCNLPDGNGQVLCRWIRQRWEELPIIYVTVKGETGDIVSGFQTGADDYIIKPFDLEVMYSRVLALLRRTKTKDVDRLVCGALSIDPKRNKVYVNHEEVMLSALEYRLLLYLMENKSKTITRERLLEVIWDINGNYVNDNTLTVAMKRLREKLHPSHYIKTIRSFGYRMEE